MEWVQVYDPLGSPWLSTLAAAAPIVVLLGLLVVGQSAPRAAVAGLAVALGVAIGAFGMPTSAALASAAYGACFGLLPIGWIVLSAVFLFHLTVRSGQFEVVKHSVAAISPDRRMQALLVAFSFGSFVEGAAGFGTPVAISAAILIGLGFSPLYAAGLALLANTSPVAFGALGTPITTLAQISGLDEMALSQMAGRQLPFFSLIVPAWLVATMSGWRGVVGCWPAILVCGGSFAGIQFLTSNFHGPTLVDVVGGLGSLAMLAIFLRFWQPAEVWRFPDEAEQPASGEPEHYTRRQIVHAWVPWVAAFGAGFSMGFASTAQRAQWRRPRAAQCPGGNRQLVLGSAGSARPGLSHRAGCGTGHRFGACRASRKSRLHVQLAIDHRHWDFLGRCALGILAAHRPGGVLPGSSSKRWARCGLPC